MDRRAWFFKNVVANVVILAVLIMTVTYLYRDDSKAVSLPAPVSKGNAEDTVALMVSANGGTEALAEMLTVLKEKKCAATFFVCGVWASEHNELLREISGAGFEIGSRGYFEKDYKKLSKARIVEEIELTHRLIKSVTGTDPRLFLPPFGSYSFSTVEGAREAGYTAVLWSRDTLPESAREFPYLSDIVNRAVRDISGGELILLHPTRETAAALPKMMEQITAKGLRFATVSEVIL